MEDGSRIPQMRTPPARRAPVSPALRDGTLMAWRQRKNMEVMEGATNKAIVTSEAVVMMLALCCFSCLCAAAGVQALPVSRGKSP